MPPDDDPVAELKRLMTEAVETHRFDGTLDHFHSEFDRMADELGLSTTERMCISLANAYRMACAQDDQHFMEALLHLLGPIMPDGIGKD